MVFPVDDESLKYLKLSGRDETTIDLVEKYSKSKVYGLIKMLNLQIHFH